MKSAGYQAALESAADKLLEALRGDSPDSLLALMTDDVVLMPPHEPVLKGKAAVRTWYEQFGCGIGSRTGAGSSSARSGTARHHWVVDSMAHQTRNVTRFLLSLIGLILLDATSPSAAAFGQKSSLPGRTVDIKVGEYYILAPDSISAGLVTLRLSQTGDVVKPFPADMEKLKADPTYHFHMIWLVRLDSAKTIADLLEAERDRAPTPWARIMGGPGFADAPESSNVTMTLKPGNYALVCYVGSAREDRNRYHLLKGMIRPLTVVGRSAPSSLPSPTLTIVLRDSVVEMPARLSPRAYRILVRNKGKRASDFGISRVKPGYTIDQAKAWRSPLLTKPPRHAVGGLVWIAADSALMTSVTLKPGDYFFGNKHVVVTRR